MKQLQLIFDAESKNKTEKKELTESFRDALRGNKEYTTLMDDLSELQSKKRSIEMSVMEQLGIIENLEKVKRDIAEAKQAMTDVAMNDYTKGETIEVKDEYGIVYEPVWSVRFKKVGYRPENFIKKNA